LDSQGLVVVEDLEEHLEHLVLVEVVEHPVVPAVLVEHPAFLELLDQVLQLLCCLP
jgi:hypothetical protein